MGPMSRMTAPRGGFLSKCCFLFCCQVAFSVKRATPLLQMGVPVSLQEVTVCLGHTTCPHWELVLREPGPAMLPQEREELSLTPGWILGLREATREQVIYPLCDPPRDTWRTQAAKGKRKRNRKTLQTDALFMKRDQCFFIPQVTPQRTSLHTQPGAPGQIREPLSMPPFDFSR